MRGKQINVNPRAWNKASLYSVQISSNSFQNLVSVVHSQKSQFYVKASYSTLNTGKKSFIKFWLRRTYIKTYVFD